MDTININTIKKHKCNHRNATKSFENNCLYISAEKKCNLEPKTSWQDQNRFAQSLRNTLKRDTKAKGSESRDGTGRETENRTKATLRPIPEFQRNEETAQHVSARKKSLLKIFSVQTGRSRNSPTTTFNFSKRRKCAVCFSSSIFFLIYIYILSHFSR